MIMDNQVVTFMGLLAGPPVIILIAWIFPRHRVAAVAVSWAIWLFCCLWLIERSVDIERRSFLHRQGQRSAATMAARAPMPHDLFRGDRTRPAGEGLLW